MYCALMRRSGKRYWERAQRKGTAWQGQPVRAWFLGLLLSVGLFACTNNPYPEEDEAEKVLYSVYFNPPKTLDPAVAYSTDDHTITGKVYDTLLEYHYLKRPYELMGGLAEGVPEPEPLADGAVQYTFVLRPDLWFQEDECFVLSQQKHRRITAEDFVFSLQRLADPAVGSPVTEPFSHLRGFEAWGKKLKERRAADPAFAQLPIKEQYAALPAWEAARAAAEDRLVITVDKPYPQILYWFAMPFSTPLPWEAIHYYDGKEGRPDFSEHPVGSGPYMLTRYEKRSRMVLSRNPHWYGARHPEWRAPGAVFPELTPELPLGEAERARFQSAVGKPLPFVDRIEYRREEESIPAFSKFLQGYYDLSGVSRESFNRVIHEGGLSAEMEERGMRLAKSVSPTIFYIGFNLDDPVVGLQGGERARLLRQAMSLAVDVPEYLRLFTNGRGIVAQTPIPPGLFGHEESYQNPYRQVNLERAAELLRQAGYPQGVDENTKRPLRLTFDVPDTSPEGRLRFLFWTNQWRRLGLNVELSATNYNKFQEKVRDGAYQIFQWGWMADYPDPENFLFLLTTPMARSVSGGPNTANFKNAQYDALFEQMKTLDNGEERLALIRQMRALLEEERPWIELFHAEDYALTHGWLHHVWPAGLSIPTVKYYDVDVTERQELRQAWNRPILWPAWAFGAALLLLLAPGVWTFYRERQ